MSAGRRTTEETIGRSMADARNPGTPASLDSRRNLPSPMIHGLQTCLKSSLFVDRHTLEGAPASGGAYALILRLEKEAAIDLPRLSPAPIAPGWYLYAGSAYGPGGLRARLARHFRPAKKLHWHIDRLTSIYAPAAALSVPGGDECAVVSELIASGTFRFAFAGFGATDCRQCKSHLLAW
jgi:Uri superfamily endonuclease